MVIKDGPIDEVDFSKIGLEEAFKLLNVSLEMDSAVKHPVCLLSINPFPSTFRSDFRSNMISAVMPRSETFQGTTSCLLYALTQHPFGQRWLHLTNQCSRCTPQPDSHRS